MPTNTIHPLISRALRLVSLINHDAQSKAHVANCLTTIFHAEEYFKRPNVSRSKVEMWLMHEDNAFTYLATFGYIILAKEDERSKIRGRQ
jgi:hypothetical protein